MRKNIAYLPQSGIITVGTFQLWNEFQEKRTGKIIPETVFPKSRENYMSQSVMIKSNKYGINLVLDPNIPFVELLKDVIEKFKASEKFFKNAELAISFEGRKLSEEEENRIIEVITENTTIQILCIVQNGSEQEAVMKQQIEYYQAVQQQFMNANTGSGDFYRGTLRSGQVIESESSVTIIGDVNPGAKIISQGNIVILGALKGNAHAGSAGDRNCFIFALDMNPIQIQIGDLIAKSPDKEKTRKHLLRREKVQTAESQIAVARDGNIYIEPVTKDILNRM